MNHIAPDANMNRFLLGIVIATAIALVVFAAISADMLLGLVAGIVVIGLITIGLAAVGVDLFGRWSAAQYKRDDLKLRHIERMAGMGLLVTGRGVPTYEPMQRQISAPVQAAQASKSIPTNGIQFDSADMNSNAINLLLFSCQLLGRDSKRIASNPECAAANIPGYNGRKWDAIINKHLKQQFDIATVPGPVDNGGGAFVPDDIGTVGDFYDRLVYSSNKKKQDDAVNALPRMTR